MSDEVDEMSAASRGSGANHSAIPNGWIPVTERLPQDGQRVLAMTAERGVTVAWIHRERMGDMVWVTLDDVYGVEATLWMPLPAPPSDDK